MDFIYLLVQQIMFAYKKRTLIRKIFCIFTLYNTPQWNRSYAAIFRQSTVQYTNSCTSPNFLNYY